MRILKTLIAFELTFIILITGLGYGSVHASPSRRWTPDSKVPGYLDDTFTPFLLADQNRTVHAFASQWVEINDGRKLAIVYRKWSVLGGWTRPVDVILSPIGGDANFLGAYMDTSDTVHLIFTTKEALTRRTSVYYSNAPAANADWGPAWSAPVLVGDSALDLNSGAIIGDKAGNLVIIYSGNRDGSGIYYLYSKDEGKSWSNPRPLLLTSDNNLSAYSLHLAVGPDQKIRATWNVVTNLGVDEALYFANYDTQASKWDTPVELERRIDLPEYFGPSFPVIVDDGREIVIMYNSGNPFTEKPVGPGRPIQRSRISLDGGLTWNDPLDSFPFHVGRSGEHAMVLDGKGTPHTLFIQRIETADEDGKYSIVGGIWHSTFENGGWANPDRFITSFAPHDVRAVVVQGNVLLAVWRKDPGVGAEGIWFSYTELDVPELPVVPLATASVDYSSAQVVIATKVPALSNSAPTIPPELLDEAPPSNLGNNPALPIMIGTVPVALILIGVIVGYHYLSSRRTQE